MSSNVVPASPPRLPQRTSPPRRNRDVLSPNIDGSSRVQKPRDNGARGPEIGRRRSPRSPFSPRRASAPQASQPSQPEYPWDKENQPPAGNPASFPSIPSPRLEFRPGIYYDYNTIGRPVSPSPIGVLRSHLSGQRLKYPRNLPREPPHGISAKTCELEPPGTPTSAVPQRYPSPQDPRRPPYRSLEMADNERLRFVADHAARENDPNVQQAASLYDQLKRSVNDETLIELYQYLRLAFEYHLTGDYRFEQPFQLNYQDIHRERGDPQSGVMQHQQVEKQEQTLPEWSRFRGRANAGNQDFSIYGGEASPEPFDAAAGSGVLRQRPLPAVGWAQDSPRYSASTIVLPSPLLRPPGTASERQDPNLTVQSGATNSESPTPSGQQPSRRSQRATASTQTLPSRADYLRMSNAQLRAELRARSIDTSAIRHRKDGYVDALLAAGRAGNFGNGAWTSH